SINGRDGDEPMRAGLPISDLVAGLYAAFCVACTLVAPRGGPARGQRVETSLVNGLVSMLAYLSAQHLATGELPVRTGNDHPIAAAYGLFHAADGDVAIAPATDDVVRRFFQVLGMEDALARPEFATYEARRRNRDAINALVAERIRTRAVDDWIARLNAAGVPCGRVADLRTVFTDPQILAQEMVLEVEHPGHGTVRMTGFPVKLSATPCRVRLPAPELGAHTELGLGELGLGPAIPARA